MHPRLAALALVAALLVTGEAPPRPQAVIATSHGEIRVALFPDEAPLAVAAFLGLADGTRESTDAAGVRAQRPFYDGLTFHRVIAGFMIQGGCPRGDGSGGPGFTFADEINAASLGLERETVILADDALNPMCAYQADDFMRLMAQPLLAARGIGPGSPRDQIDAALRELKQITLRRFYEKLGYRYDDTLPPSHRPVKYSLALANSGPDTNGSQFFINLADTPHLTGKHTVFGEVVAGAAVVEAIGRAATGPDSRPIEPVRIVSVRSLAAAKP